MREITYMIGSRIAFCQLSSNDLCRTVFVTTVPRASRPHSWRPHVCLAQDRPNFAEEA
jgi:hypothetical protein